MKSTVIERELFCSDAWAVAVMSLPLCTTKCQVDSSCVATSEKDTLKCPEFDGLKPSIQASGLRTPLSGGERVLAMILVLVTILS